MAKKTDSRTGTKKSGPVKMPAKVTAASKTPTAIKKTSAKLSPMSPAKKPEAKKVSRSLDFIGSFPLRRANDEKKNDQKKTSIGPVFPVGTYKIATRDNDLSLAMLDAFEKTYFTKHVKDTLKRHFIDKATHGSLDNFSSQQHRYLYTKEAFESLRKGDIDVLVLNMKEVPLELSSDLVNAASLRREDPRDAMITKGTYGAIQELPTNARIGANSRRRIMQIRALRPDLQIESVRGSVNDRLKVLDETELAAVLVSWASLRRQNISPRHYVALQPEHMLPAACQGNVAVLCRATDTDLIAKLNYIDDSEASWSSRCERAFLLKFGEFGDVPIGANAHRKGTQDPWILDAVIGDPASGEVLRHREIGTSRCKPESLADKAYVGILAKGARKFLPFQFD